MNAISLLKSLNLNISTLQISHIKNHDETIGFQSTIINEKGFSTSGGFGKTLGQANKIACSEFIERSFVKSFYYCVKSQKLWNLDKYPSACGFAVGYSKINTIERSILEAAERLILSDWIDKKIPMQKIENPQLNKTSQFFYDRFESILFFKSILPVQVGKVVKNIFVVSTIAFANNGAFLGSNSSFIDSPEVWQHALIESHRHYLIYKNDIIRNNFTSKRTHFFANNKKEALNSIPFGPYQQQKSTIKPFFSKLITISPKHKLFIARTIFSGWRPWHLGAETRFLY